MFRLMNVIPERIIFISRGITVYLLTEYMKYSHWLVAVLASNM